MFQGKIRAPEEWRQFLGRRRMFKVCSLVCCRGLLFKQFKEVILELEVHIVALSMHCIWKAPERLSSLKS